MRKLVVAAAAMLAASAAHAGQYVRSFPYESNPVYGAKLAFCNGGDISTGGEVVCPEGATVQKSVKIQVNGVQGWKSVCLAPGEDPLPVWVKAVCWHSECQPTEGSCNVDP